MQEFASVTACLEQVIRSLHSCEASTFRDIGAGQYAGRSPTHLDLRNHTHRTV